MKPFSNKLTPAQAERLAMLAEECGEVVQAIGKVLRHGYGSYCPGQEFKGDNQSQLRKECRDVAAVLTLMANAGDLSALQGYELREAIRQKLQYAHHQEAR